MSKRNTFQPGNSLGKGRPAGSRNKAALALEQMLEGEGGAITRKAIQLAKQGNPMALKLCFERLISVVKERPLALELPKIRTLEDLYKAFDAIMQAALEGRITSEQAANLTKALETGRKWIETEDLVRRMEEMKIAIEEMKNNERRAA